MAIKRDKNEIKTKKKKSGKYIEIINEKKKNVFA